MKERGILFSGQLVRALLAGTKTQTRRLMKPQPHWSPEWGTAAGGNGAWIYGNEKETGDQWWVKFDEDHQRRACTEEAYGWGARAGCPYGVPEDRLWVRETWSTLTGNGIRTVYRADGEDPRTGWDDTPPERRPAMRWRPSIFMPRSASRITLEVTEVRVQRLQDISEEDAKAEGVTPPSYSETWLCIPKGTDGPYEVYVEPDAEERSRLEHVRHQAARPMWGHRPEFSLLWNQINGQRASWESNPWVWAISFRRLP